jgi:threonine dehydratase
MHQPISLAEIEAAKERVAGSVVRTPLVRLNLDDDAPAEIYLKLENLQPIGSFKIRGAVNVLAQLDPAELAAGVWTVSGGTWHSL